MSESQGLASDSASLPHMEAALLREHNLLYIDPRRLSRDCVSRELAEYLPELSIEPVMSVGEFSLGTFTREHFALIILHTHMGSVEDSGVSGQLSLLGQIMPGVPVVLLSDNDHVDHIVHAFRLGIRGYIPTSLPMRDAAEAIRFVWVGGSFVPPSALAASIRPPSAQGGVLGGPKRIPARFTPQQHQVLRLLWQGKPNKIIAHELKIRESTVKVHIRHIMKKLHARNRTQVVLLTHSPSYDETA
jgi:DNA-binding NarL/FixJ family response regulator